jgi:hypothetical protein
MTFDEACIKVAQALQYKQRCARDAGEGARNRRRDNPTNHRDDRGKRPNLLEDPFRSRNDGKYTGVARSAHHGFGSDNDLPRDFSGNAHHHGIREHNAAATPPVHTSYTAHVSQYHDLLIAMGERDELQRELNHRRQQIRRLQDDLLRLAEGQPAAHRPPEHPPEDDTRDFGSYR